MNYLFIVIYYYNCESVIKKFWWLFVKVVFVNRKWYFNSYFTIHFWFITLFIFRLFILIIYSDMMWWFKSNKNSRLKID